MSTSLFYYIFYLFIYTILNLAYILGGAAIASIVVGEIVMSIRNKKA